MLSFSAGGFAIRICTNCYVLSRPPWAWARSVPTGWLIRFALLHSPLFSKGLWWLSDCKKSFLIPHWAGERPSTTCTQTDIHPPLTSWKVTMASTGNNATSQAQSKSLRCCVWDVFQLLSTVVEDKWVVKREHCVLCFHFGYCYCLFACWGRGQLKGVLLWKTLFWL